MFKVEIKELIKDAAPGIATDRAKFLPIVQYVAAYAEQHKLQISAPNWMTKPDQHPETFTLWSQNILHHANEIVNTIYIKFTQIVYLKTSVAYEEFEVHIWGRRAFYLCRYPQIKRVDIPKLFNHHSVESKTYGRLSFLDPEIEIMEQYHKLYAPYPEYWPAAAEQEENMFAHFAKIDAVKVGAGADDIFAIARKLRQSIYNQCKLVDLGVLVGHWAIYNIAGGTAPIAEKIQIATALTADNISHKINALLADMTAAKTSHRTEDVQVPGDYWLKRTTYYIHGDSTTRIALMDTFNSPTYELVPYVSRQNVKIGNAYLICRFLMIDRWLIKILEAAGTLSRDVSRAKCAAILSKVAIARDLKDFKFGDQYDGVWRDMVIEKRKMIKAQGQKFSPYVPAHAIKAFGKLRSL